MNIASFLVKKKKKKVRGETEKSGKRSYLDIVPLLTET